MVAARSHRSTVANGFAVVVLEREPQVVRKPALAGGKDLIRHPEDPGCVDLDEHRPLDAVELEHRGIEVRRISHLEEEHGGKSARRGHDGSERGNLLRNLGRVVDALGAQCLLEDGADGFAVLEDECQRLAEADAAGLLSVTGSPPLSTANCVVRRADPHIVEADRRRSITCQRTPPGTAGTAGVSCRRLSQVGPASGAAIPYLSGYDLLTVATVPFDRSVLKVNQMILMVVIVVAYVVALAYPGVAWVLPVLALMMLAAVASPALNVPRLLYIRVLRPSGIVKPRIVQEDPAPHRFAQLVGGVFLVAASVFMVAGLLLVAWVLAWIVVALAFLNFAFNICVGCIVYAQLVRAGLLPLKRAPAR
jgi:hypothetical protein